MLTSHNRLQLPGIPQCVLDDGTARAQNISLIGQQVLLLLGEVYPPVLDNPVPILSEIDNSAFGVKEEEILRVGNGNRSISFLRTRCDLIADSADEKLSAKLANQTLTRVDGRLTPEKMPNSSPATLLFFVSCHTRS